MAVCVWCPWVDKGVGWGMAAPVICGRVAGAWFGVADVVWLAARQLTGAGECELTAAGTRCYASGKPYATRFDDVIRADGRANNVNGSKGARFSSVSLPVCPPVRPIGVGAVQGRAHQRNTQAQQHAEHARRQPARPAANPINPPYRTQSTQRALPTLPGDLSNQSRQVHPANPPPLLFPLRVSTSSQAHRDASVGTPSEGETIAPNNTRRPDAHGSGVRRRRFTGRRGEDATLSPNRAWTRDPRRAPKSQKLHNQRPAT